MPALGRTLVTGGHGFAGRHLVELLRRADVEVSAPAHAQLDLLDAGELRSHLGEAAPVVVFHLAAFSSPALSWERPRDALVTNVEMTLNLLEAVRREAPAAAVLLIGSGQIYGEPDELPVDEDAPLAPGNPYAVSKATVDLLGRQYADAFGMRVVLLRAFNHAGPGQSADYVLSSLAKQIAAAESANASEVALRTGDPSSARDFTDVRDVVRAYALAATLERGTYNVCSGHATKVAELVEMFAEHAAIPVRHEVDPHRLRAHDARAMRGSNARIRAATGWGPEIPLERTVRDTLDWWRALSAGASASAP